VSSFSSVSVIGTFDIALIQSQESKIVVEAATSDDCQKVVSYVSGSTLQLTMPQTPSGKPKVYVFSPDFEEIYVSLDGGRIETCTDIVSNDLSVTTKNTGIAKFSVNVSGQLRIVADDVHEFLIQGISNEANVTLNTVKIFSALSLNIATLYATCHDVKKAYFMVNDEINVTGTGQGLLYYRGEAREGSISVTSNFSVVKQ